MLWICPALLKKYTKLNDFFILLITVSTLRYIHIPKKDFHACMKLFHDVLDKLLTLASSDQVLGRRTCNLRHMGHPSLYSPETALTLQQWKQETKCLQLFNQLEKITPLEKHSSISQRHAYPVK